ncbi:MAG: UDP-N-acetylglucosamine 2-epimerase (non-hydrolyzing) [Bryobacterales bacterium]|nr:UDP-N-acetylglucosamine 2-epimerase (non-hydrolyzing) [Bryobacterales bacterium]
MRILSLVGARPQFIKAAVLCRALAGRAGVAHGVIHTGQHYDREMSGVFFEELGIPAPEHNLGVGSGSHAVQTAEMMKRLEPLLAGERPDWLLLYGDTNSTLAGALVAAKAGVRTAHVEAGLRSFVRSMPEEVNRVVADHLNDLLFCPTAAAMENLRREGLDGRARMTGDVMYDAARIYTQEAERRGGGLAEQWGAGAFALATLHRAANTDDPDCLQRILAALDRVSAEVCPVVLPVHPRTRARLGELGWRPAAVTLIEPLSYLDMLLMESRARFILTDSGGVQKEAYFARKPCITLRDETEWVETLDRRCNVLAGSDPARILAAAQSTGGCGPWSDIYGNGDAGGQMADILTQDASAFVHSAVKRETAVSVA